MRTLLKNAEIYTQQGFQRRDILIDGQKVLLNFSKFDSGFDTAVDLNDLYIVPGFADVHVHLREPGFSYKETIRSGTEAAAHGGYTAVCAMPNLRPVPSSPEALEAELAAIRRDALIHVYPYGAITREQKGRGELAELAAMAPLVCAFSDDGKGIQEASLMREAMLEAARLHKMIVAHCEDEAELKPGGCIHDGEYARLHHHVGISSASEWKQVQRDVQLAAETGVHYHVCHVSTKESVAVIREAKARGVHVTAETGPHYLMFTDMDLRESGAWKMNPPIRSKEDRDALIDGILDGTIDCLITDHAPHSAEEKARGLDRSAFGIVGLETAFPAMYRKLVLSDPRSAEAGGDGLLAGAAAPSGSSAGKSGTGGAITLEKLIELMAVNPRRVFGLPGPLEIADGCDADLTVLDLGKRFRVDSSGFYSMGRSTLFDGMELQGQVVSTYVGGRKVYDREKGIFR